MGRIIKLSIARAVLKTRNAAESVASSQSTWLSLSLAEPSQNRDTQGTLYIHVEANEHKTASSDKHQMLHLSGAFGFESPSVSDNMMDTSHHKPCEPVHEACLATLFHHKEDPYTTRAC